MQIGWLGPLVITAIPFGGGVWTGMSLARVMNLPGKQTQLAVGVGTVIGCLIFVLASLGILSLVDVAQK